MDRREFLKRSLMAGAGLTMASATSLRWSQPARAAGPAKWGSLCAPRTGEDSKMAITDMEAKVGRSFAVVHQRLKWNVPLVNNFTTWAAGTVRTPMISWFTRTSSGLVSWASIAAGAQDAWITQQAKAIKAAGWPAYFAFHKEPEDEGTATDWKAAHEHVWNVFQSVGATNLTWIVTLMASTYRGGNGGPAAWMPPHYHLLGVDGYNRYTYVKKPWKSFTQVFGAAHTFAVQLGRGLFIQEYGCVEGETNRKAQWFDDTAAVIKTWPEVVGICYTSELGAVGADVGCPYWIDTSPSSLAAFSTMGADPYFQG